MEFGLEERADSAILQRLPKEFSCPGTSGGSGAADIVEDTARLVELLFSEFAFSVFLIESSLGLSIVRAEDLAMHESVKLALSEQVESAVRQLPKEFACPRASGGKGVVDIAEDTADLSECLLL